MTRFNLILLSAVLALTGALTGCSSMKSTLGMERKVPDEFAVVERAPLTLPPNFDLVPPQPGAARPQETQSTASAKGLVLGSESSAPKDNSESASEQALLSKAGAGQVDPAIRSELAIPEDSSKDQTVAQQLGIVSGDANGKALDPADEAARLKKSNVKTTPMITKPADDK